MALPLLSPPTPLLLHHPLPISTPSTRSLFLLRRYPLRLSSSSAASNDTANTDDKDPHPTLLRDDLLRRVSTAKDADQVLDIMPECRTVPTTDCNAILSAALDRGNHDLALSVFSDMRRGGSGVWGRPDVETYKVMVRGLAAALRVSDAIEMVACVSRVGVSSGEEVPFGMVVPCPECMIAVAVAQPQHGIQVASCSKCRYQYELVSGDIISIDSEEISMDTSTWEKALRFLQILQKNTPAAVHSIVVRSPSGSARTYRFATKTVELPAQEGERVTVSLAAPSNVYRTIGPLRLSAKSPGFGPGEPMCLTNHASGLVSQLLRAPIKEGESFLLNPSVILPTLALLATGDAASGIIDLSLPRIISMAAVASVALGTTVNLVVLPQLSKLPQRTVDIVAFKQQLLSQYDLLQNRIKGLREAAENEVWMLARMCQLESKIVAMGESSYRARQIRVKSVRESLESSLLARIELLESYAKISSMIEIEVEMDSDVLAAEAVSNAENIAEKIQQIMEIENLEERWRIQAEANDEVERLLSSQPVSPEHV